jgi:hypothetical protein
MVWLGLARSGLACLGLTWPLLGYSVDLTGYGLAWLGWAVLVWAMLLVGHYRGLGLGWAWAGFGLGLGWAD